LKVNILNAKLNLSAAPPQEGGGLHAKVVGCYWQILKGAPKRGTVTAFYGRSLNLFSQKEEVLWVTAGKSIVVRCLVEIGVNCSVFFKVLS